MEFLLQGHEINLKGGNRGFFSTRLRANLEVLLEGCEAQVGMRGLGLVVGCPDAQGVEVRARLDYALGVQTLMAGQRTEPSIEAITPAALAMIASQTGASFGLNVLRPDKALELGSYEVAAAVGQSIARDLGLEVNLRAPERRCTIVLSRKGALVSRAPEAGPGGMPAATAGRMVGLLSSGFDSPVAAYRMIRRGARVVLLHFHGTPPAGRGSSLPPIEALARQLTRYQLHTRLYVCPFEPVQRAIVAAAPSPLRILLYRRMMLRIAAALAERVGGHGIVTGDSLAQVASQTVLNLEAVSAALCGGAAPPVYRPLIGHDKIEIQAEARRIGTFDISTEMVDDCCSAFLPRSPALAATPAELAAAEQELDTAALVETSMATLQARRFRLAGGAVVAE